MAKNIISESRPPNDIESKANKLLSVLLNGNSVNRKNCFQFGIDEKNASIHSLASHLRHNKLIPILSPREEHGIANYSIDVEEIRRFKSPHLREIQKQEMRDEIESKRKKRLLNAIMKMVENEQKRPIPDTNFLNQLQQILWK